MTRAYGVAKLSSQVAQIKWVWGFQNGYLGSTVAVYTLPRLLSQTRVQDVRRLGEHANANTQLTVCVRQTG